MADRFPLILNTSANQIQEIASGDSLDLTGTNIANAGIITAGNVTIGAATTDLIVTGDARITGILTIGTSSLKLDGPNNLVNVGTALTLGHTQGLQFHTQNLHSAGFEVNQVNASGIITATGADINGDVDVDGHTNLDNVSISGVATVTGNLNVGGVLTYEDVTSIDSVGIITARSSIKLDADGSSSSNFLSIGADDDLKIFHQSNVDKIESSANGFHIRQINGGDLHIHAGANTGSANNRLVARAGGKAELYYAGALKLSTETGGVNITGVCTATTFSGSGASLTNVDATTLDSIDSSSFLRSDVADTSTAAKTFQGGGGAVTINGGSDIRLVGGSWTGNSAAKIQHHNGYMYITTGTNGLYFRDEGSNNWWAIDTNGHFQPTTDSALDIGTNSLRVRNGYFDTLYGDGSNLTGVTSVGGATGVDFNDGVKIRLGDSQDLQIYHSGDWNYIQSYNSKNLAIQVKDNENAIIAIPDGEVQLYHNNSKKFETTSGGSKVTGNFIVNSGDVSIDVDSQKLLLGASDDLQLSHDGSTNIIDGRFHPIELRHQSEVHIKCVDDGAVELYHDNSKKFETISIGNRSLGALITTNNGNDCLVAEGSGNLKFTVGTYTGNASTGCVSFDARTYDTNKARLHKWTSPNDVGGSYGNYSEAWFDGGTYRHIYSHPDGFKIEHHVLPYGNNTYDLGSSSLRWNNIYTNDLNLSNEGGKNDVDNTWGNYTIQEGESDLFLINNRNGKKYKFNLTEVS